MNESFFMDVPTPCYIDHATILKVQCQFFKVVFKLKLRMTTLIRVIKCKTIIKGTKIKKRNLELFYTPNKETNCQIFKVKNQIICTIAIFEHI